MNHIDPDLFAAFVEGSLPDEEAARIRSHLGECRACAAEYADLVRYHLAWLANSEGFRITDRDRRILGGRGPTRPSSTVRRGFRSGAALLASVACITAVWVAVGVALGVALYTAYLALRPRLTFLGAGGPRETVVTACSSDSWTAKSPSGMA